MKEPYSQLCQVLQNQKIPLEHYAEFLSLSLQDRFEALSQSLRQHNISLSNYLAYLELSSKTTISSQENPSDLNSQEMASIEFIGQYLLEEKRIDLSEINSILRLLIPLKPKNFMQQLFRLRKIQTDEFSHFLSGEIPSTPNSLYGLKKVPPYEFYLKLGDSLKKYGSYVVLEELARGGMGIVYKAYHIELNRLVALKVLISGNLASEKSIQRFRREIEIMAKLQHEGIVHVYDSGMENGSLYLVMEYIEGQTLTHLSSKLTLYEKVFLTQQILNALQYAHQQGVVHRDLKLDNILITADQRPKILDFGIAKLLQKETEASEKLTNSGIVLGTSLYMAPEQASGNLQAIDPQTDVYAIGVCLYYLLTKHFPHEAKSIPQLLQHIIHQESTPPSRYFKNIRYDLEAILVKALEKEKCHRYRSAEAFAKDLNRYLQGYFVEALERDAPTRIRKWIRKRKKIFLFSFLGVSLFLLALLLQFGLHYQEKTLLFHQKYKASLEKAKSGQTSQTSETFFYYLQSWNLCNEALQIWPQHASAEQQKWAVGECILNEVLTRESRYFGDYVIEEMQGLETIVKAKRLQRKQLWEKQKNAHWKNEENCFQSWLSHLCNKPFSKEDGEEAIFEILKMTTPFVNQKLLALLQEGNIFFEQRKYLQNPLKTPYYLWIAHLIRRRKVSEALPFIEKEITLLVEQEVKKTVAQRDLERIHYLVELSRYFLTLKIYNKADDLFRWRSRLGENTLFWNRTEFINKKLYQEKSSLQEKISNDLKTELEYLQRGKSKEEQGDFEEAIADFTEAIRLNSNSAEAYNFRGFSKSFRQDLEGAIVDFNEAIRLNPLYAEAFHNRGSTKQDKQDLTGAIVDFNEAIRLNPQLSESYNNRGAAKYSTEDFTGAIADYTEAIRLNPQFFDAYYNRGNAKKIKKDLEGAISDYTEAIRLNPQYVDAYNNRGTTKYLKQDLEGAISDLTEVIRLDPQSSDAYNNRGSAYHNKQNLERAISDYTEAIRLNPQFAGAYQNRGFAKQNKQDLEGSIADFSEAIRINPQFLRSYLNRGNSYFKLKQQKNAKEDFKMLLKLSKVQYDPQIEQIKTQIFQMFPELKTQ
ncbi:MAG: tetratricopeptide repeat protein [Planctomycetota bacterium]